MNYYNPNPNYYLSYPYTNPGMTQYLQQPQVQPNIQQPPAPQGLNGKIVDSEDVVKATEVPIGGYGIFPKADLSEIYIKSWNNNGTTSVITFRPIINESKNNPPAGSAEIVSDLTTQIISRIDTLETKIDSMLASKVNNNLVNTPHPIKKEVLTSAY